MQTLVRHITGTCLLALGVALSGCGDQHALSPETLGASVNGETTGCMRQRLLFSEYVEGTGWNKAIEIFNPTDSSVWLQGCSVRVFANGSLDASSTIHLAAYELAPGEAYVLCHTGFTQPEKCNQLNHGLFHNGDDALDLVCDQTVQDVFGRIGEDPGSAWGLGSTSSRDRTLRLTCDFRTISCGGGLEMEPCFDPSRRFSGHAPDSFEHLGHTCLLPESLIRIGSESTLEVATWNIRNFPDNSSTPEKTAALISHMNLDLLAVQEIASVQAFSDLVDELGAYVGILSSHKYPWGLYHKTGFVFRQGAMEPLGEARLLFEHDTYAFPRPALQTDFLASKSDGSGMTLRIINLHLKSGTSPDDRNRRRIACQKLKAYVDELLAADAACAVVILGDFNMALTDSPSHNVFAEFLEDQEHYKLNTEEVHGVEGYSLITSQRLVDHILITSGLLEEYQGGSTFTVPLDHAIDHFDYLDEVSDHRPVVTLFR